MEKKSKIFIAHNITASQGGHLLGIFNDYKKAKQVLLELMNWQDGTVDWSHFIRVGEINQSMSGVLGFKKSVGYEILCTEREILKEDLISVFDTWSKRMDFVYGIDGKDRHDATMWGENPADWMSPYKDDIFNAWCNYDVGGPF